MQSEAEGQEPESPEHWNPPSRAVGWPGPGAGGAGSHLPRLMPSGSVYVKQQRFTEVSPLPARPPSCPDHCVPSHTLGSAGPTEPPRGLSGFHSIRPRSGLLCPWAGSPWVRGRRGHREPHARSPAMSRHGPRALPGPLTSWGWKDLTGPQLAHCTLGRALGAYPSVLPGDRDGDHTAQCP